MTDTLTRTESVAERGYRDGYDGRPRRSDSPAYLEAYRRGAAEWNADMREELKEWERAHGRG
jgi:hypothetical protein